MSFALCNCCAACVACVWSCISARLTLPIRSRLCPESTFGLHWHYLHSKTSSISRQTAAPQAVCVCVSVCIVLVICEQTNQRKLSALHHLSSLTFGLPAALFANGIYDADFGECCRIVHGTIYGLISV